MEEVYLVSEVGPLVAKMYVTDFNNDGIILLEIATIGTKTAPPRLHLVIFLQENIKLVARSLRSSLKIMKGTVVFATNGIKTPDI